MLTVVVLGAAFHVSTRQSAQVSWSEALSIALATLFAGFEYGRICDTDPEVAFHALRRRGKGNRLLLASALLAGSAMIVLAADFGRGLTAELIWGAAFLAIAACFLEVLRLPACRAATALGPLRVAVIGTAAAQRDILERLEREGRCLHRVTATLDPATELYGAALEDHVRLEHVDQLIDLIRSEEIDAVLIDQLGLRGDHVAAVVQALRLTPIEIRLVCRPHRPDLECGALLAGTTVPQTRYRSAPLSGYRGAVKRGEDLFVATLLVAVLLPLLAVLALAVRLETPGPVFFRQERYGRNNRRFNVLKFRTMRHAARDVAGAVQAVPGDGRVTRVGRVLRKLSLDELPQLFNVLAGSMSVVGPRPHAIWTRAGGMLFEEAVEHYAARHNVKPGMTGLAQISGWRGPTRSITDLQRRVDHDLSYIDNWSLQLDLMILVKTVPALLRGVNAC